MISALGVLVPNKSLQRTFDLPPIFAAAKTGVASNAPEHRRYAYSPKTHRHFHTRIEGDC